MKPEDDKAKIRRYEKLLFRLGAMEQAPCFRCGYNGEGYYQPDKHKCAAMLHKEQERK